MTSPAIDKQLPPTGGNGRPVHDLVIEDFIARKVFGKEKYGKVLRPFNGRSGLVDLYQELLDACCYVRQLLEEQGWQPTG